LADENAAKQKDVQEKVLIYQILQNHLEEFNKQAAALESRIGELEVTGNALREIGNSEEGAETLVPIGGGCYAYGKLSDRSKFLVEVGAGIMANKTLQEAASLIEERKKEVDGVNGRLQSEMQKISTSINTIMLDLQKIMQREKAAKGAVEKESGEEPDDDVIVD